MQRGKLGQSRIRDLGARDRVSEHHQNERRVNVDEERGDFVHRMKDERVAPSGDGGR